jgi:hypothetical protein
VPPDNIAGAFIPDYRLHIAKLLNGTLELFIFFVAGF